MRENFIWGVGGENNLMWHKYSLTPPVRSHWAVSNCPFFRTQNQFPWIYTLRSFTVDRLFQTIFSFPWGYEIATAGWAVPNLACLLLMRFSFLFFVYRTTHYWGEKSLLCVSTIAPLVYWCTFSIDTSGTVNQEVSFWTFLHSVVF